jgi:2-dehydro-3-deoxyphosphooctonate aldolase (KDO 8-P synthase)
MHAADFVDVLQIPCLPLQANRVASCRRKNRKGGVNIKKGQFLAPEQMKFAAQKVEEAGNKNVMLTERGTTFGYSDLVGRLPRHSYHARIWISSHS